MWVIESLTECLRIVRTSACPYQVDLRKAASADNACAISPTSPSPLAEVLQAREALERPSTDFAYVLVLKDLEARRL